MVCVQKLFLFQVFGRVCDFVGDLFPAFFAEQSVVNGKCGVDRSGCFIAHDDVNGVDVAVIFYDCVNRCVLFRNAIKGCDVPAGFGYILYYHSLHAIYCDKIFVCNALLAAQVFFVLF